MALASSNANQCLQAATDGWAPLLSLAHIAVSYLSRDNSSPGVSKNDSVRSRMASVDENISRPSSSSPNLSSSSSMTQNRDDSPTLLSRNLAKSLSDGRSRKRLLDHYMDNESLQQQASLSTTAHQGKQSKSSISPSAGQYYCEECDKSYSTASNLARHRQIHQTACSGEMLACSTCNKQYVSQAALAMHQLTHENLHECNICGKKFSRLWLLQGHLRCHTQEKPFTCEVCGKSFADRSNFRVHTRLHSSDKAYSCPNCNRGFALKSYVTKHMESCKGAVEDCNDE